MAFVAVIGGAFCASVFFLGLYELARIILAAINKD